MKYLLIIFFSVQLLAQPFEEQVLKYLQKEFPEYQKIEIQLHQNFSSDDKIEIDYTRNINLSKGIVFIPVIATKGKKTSASVVSIKVQLFKKLLVANKDYEKKELLNISGFEEKVLDVTRLNGNPVSVDFAVLNYRAKTFIKKMKSFSKKKLKRFL